MHVGNYAISPCADNFSHASIHLLASRMLAKITMLICRSLLFVHIFGSATCHASEDAIHQSSLAALTLATSISTCPKIKGMDIT